MFIGYVFLILASGRWIWLLGPENSDSSSKTTYIVLFPGLNSSIQVNIHQFVFFQFFFINRFIWLFDRSFDLGFCMLLICLCLIEFRPGNKTIYVVFDEESEFSGPRTPKLSPDQVFEENVPHKNLLICFFSLLVFC